MSKHNYLKCKVCNQLVAVKDIVEHLKIVRYIPFQTYLYEHYYLQPNYYIHLIYKVWNYMYWQYRNNNQNREDINQYYQ